MYRDYPIIGGNTTAQIAIAAHCAKDQGKYWEYTDLVWANQSLEPEERLELDETVLTDFAETTELDMETFNACFTAGTALDLIRADFAAGQAFAVSGTPTFFIEGQRLVGAQPLDEFLNVIDAELVKKGFNPPPREGSS
jgi:protein-disulfide isomerase